MLSALAEGVRGHGAIIGEAITDANEVLLAINARAETICADRQAVKDFSDAYGVAAQDILTALETQPAPPAPPSPTTRRRWMRCSLVLSACPAAVST